MKRRRPWIMWIALISLGVMVVAQFGMSVDEGPALLLSAVLSFFLLLGLWHGQRWAYVVTVVVVLITFVVGVADGDDDVVPVLMCNSLVAIPVLLSTRYFWVRSDGSGLSPPDAAQRAVAPPHPPLATGWCPQCRRGVPPQARFCPTCGLGLAERHVPGSA